MVVFDPHGEVEKAIPVARLAAYKLLAVVGLEILVKTLADKNMATVVPNFVLFMRWQRLLDTDPRLEGNVADSKANPAACHQLGQVSVLQYFEGRPAPWTTNMCSDRLDFLEKFLLQRLHCAGKQGIVASGR